jgi:hypothetical protein
VFGNSLFVWGALIGVILAAMSSGYAMGGWLADRYPGGAVLAGLLLASGAWTFLLAWKGHPVMFAVAEWIQDPRGGPCLAASRLLAPPAFGLSGALPALLRLSIADMGHPRSFVKGNHILFVHPFFNLCAALAAKSRRHHSPVTI